MNPHSNPLLGMVLGLLQPLDGYKSYLGAGGLAAVAVWQFMSGQHQAAAHSAAMALCVLGIAHKLDKGRPAPPPAVFPAAAPPAATTAS